MTILKNFLISSAQIKKKKQQQRRKKKIEYFSSLIFEIIIDLFCVNKTFRLKFSICMTHEYSSCYRHSLSDLLRLSSYRNDHNKIWVSMSFVLDQRAALAADDSQEIAEIKFIDYFVI